MSRSANWLQAYSCSRTAKLPRRAEGAPGFPLNIGRLGLSFGLERALGLHLAIRSRPAGSGAASGCCPGSFLLGQIPFELGSHALHDAAAVAGAAGAEGPVAHVFKVVIHRNLFARLDRPQ